MRRALESVLARCLLATALSLPQTRPADAQVGDEPLLRICECVVVPPSALAEAIRLRIGGEVTYEPTDVVAPGSWALTVSATPDGASVEIESPAGDIWRRDVVLSGDATVEENSRALALASEYLLVLAEAPFVARPEEEVPPEWARVGIAQEVPEAPLEAEADQAAPASRPAEPSQETTPPPEPLPHDRDRSDRLRIGVDLIAGASGDLSSTARGESAAFAMAARAVAEWPWGLWVFADAGWHYSEASDPATVTLHVVPGRVGSGAVLPLADWNLRVGFCALLEGWWVRGGEPRSGWRSGAGLVVDVTWGAIEWLSLGLDVGVDLLPHGIELIFGDVPVFSMGQWRWRAGLNIGLRYGIGM